MWKKEKEKERKKEIINCKKNSKRNFLDYIQESEEEQNEQKRGFFANENEQENNNNLTHKISLQM